MLSRSFCHLQGLRPAGEEMLWRRGILSWGDFERAGRGVFSVAKEAALRQGIAASRLALSSGDAAHFLQRLPMAHSVRLLPDLACHTAFVDVESDGLGQAARITTVAVYCAGAVRAFVRGLNLEGCADALAEAGLLVTYNGRRFDLPLLRREALLPACLAHLDLCPVLHAWGHYGGLKATERRLHITRPGLADLQGSAAVGLWQRYQQLGDCEALDLLLRYNARDAVNLECIAWRIWTWSMAGYHLRASLSPCPVTTPTVIGVPWGSLAL